MTPCPPSRGNLQEIDLSAFGTFQNGFGDVLEQPGDEQDALWGLCRLNTTCLKGRSVGSSALIEQASWTARQAMPPAWKQVAFLCTHSKN